MTDFLSRTLFPALIKPRRSIGGIMCDVTLDENHEDGLTITEFPVESGATISDHAVIKPKQLTIRAAASDSGGEVPSSGDRRSTDIYNQLLALMEKREPIDIITGRRSYKNMLIEALSTTTDATTDNILIVTIACREVVIVSTKTTSIPPRARHQNGAKTGGVADKGEKSPQDGSALQQGAGTQGQGYRRPGGPAASVQNP